jgi:hypothetical protein
VIIAVDFDGTLCEHKFPEIGVPHDIVIKRLMALKWKGHKVILWTCRSGDHLRRAIEWCQKQGLMFDAVNDDIPEIKNSEFGRTKSHKVYADIYLDDHNLEMDHADFLQDLMAVKIEQDDGGMVCRHVTVAESR